VATLNFDGVSGWVRFTPISSALSNLPNGAGTIAALARRPNAGRGYLGLLQNSTNNDWFHGLKAPSAADPGDTQMFDDDGLVGSTSNNFTGGVPGGTTADDFYIAAVAWSTGTSTERFHLSSTIGSAESWQHVDAGGTNGGTRSGPGTSGRFYIGTDSTTEFFTGDIALVAVWAGTKLTDLQVEDLWISKKTSDWCNHAAGTPTLLIELTSTSPTDIGANPSTFGTTNAGVTATGLNPTGWTFDGCGAVVTPPQSLNSAVHLLGRVRGG